MSSMAALVLLAAAASRSPPATITAEQAMANYQALVHGATGAGRAAEVDCAKATGDQIVVCANRSNQKMRLPLPDERAEPGEVVHHLGEPPRPDPGPPRTPSRLMQTLGKAFGLMREAVTGEDPDD